MDFIHRHQDTTFFMYYPMNLVHNPNHNPPGYEGEKFKNMMHYMDVLVEKVRKKTVDLGIDQNTLILFTGDNGFYYLQHSKEIKVRANVEVRLFDQLGKLVFKGISDSMGKITLTSITQQLPEGVYIIHETKIPF